MNELSTFADHKLPPAERTRWQDAAAEICDVLGLAEVPRVNWIRAYDGTELDKTFYCGTNIGSRGGFVNKNYPDHVFLNLALRQGKFPRLATCEVLAHELWHIAEIYGRVGVATGDRELAATLFGGDVATCFATHDIPTVLTLGKRAGYYQKVHGGLCVQTVQGDWARDDYWRWTPLQLDAAATHDDWAVERYRRFLAELRESGATGPNVPAGALPRLPVDRRDARSGRKFFPDFRI